MDVIFLSVFFTVLNQGIHNLVWQSWRTQLVGYQMKMYAKVIFLFIDLVLIALGSFNKQHESILCKIYIKSAYSGLT